VKKILKEIQIGDRKIGVRYPPFIVAEVGINHEGHFDKAIECVDAAIKADADCVKFQCHIAEAEMIPTDSKAKKISEEELWDVIKRCELTENEEKRIKQYCEEKGIIYLCTPFSREAANRLQSMNVLAFKVGSGECNNIPLLEHIAKMNKPIILSTGMNDIESIKKSVAIIQRYNCPLMLMHCTSMYPTPYGKVRLGAIKELRETFDLPIGLSDHSIGIYTCLGAVVLGACALEKHFTVSRQWPGPDIHISMEPDELAELAMGSRAIFSALSGRKTVLPEEQPVIDFGFASVVTITPIEMGEIFTLKNTWVKRPNGYIMACDLHRVLGKKALKFLEKDYQIRPRNVENW